MMPEIRRVYTRLSDHGHELVFETPHGNVTMPLSFAWAAADLYAALSELVERRVLFSAKFGYSFKGTDGRYVRAVAALKKADDQ